jgi:hypothetical protein
MKFTAKRSLAAAAVALAAVVTPLSLSGVLPFVGGGPASFAGAGTPASPDKIVYGQTTSSPSTFYEYVPGNGSATTTQAVKTTGSCGSPSVSGAPILTLAGKDYASTPNSNYYTNASSPAVVGTHQQQTGVCTISPGWTIDNKTGKGAEAIDFSPGSDTAVIGPNRLFIDAQIPIQRKDSGDAEGSVTVGLVEFDSSGDQLAAQTCTINGSEGTQITADTNGSGTGGNCTGPTAPVFDTVEVQDLTPNTSMSVVGPAATFTLGSEICGGQSIEDSGPVPATLALTGTSTECKTYTTFTSGPNGAGQNEVSFDGFSAGAVPFTVTITWPAVPECQPYADSNHPDPNSTPIPAAETLPVCAPHEFSLDGTTFYDQSYCQTPVPAGPGVDPEASLCTTNKTYNNDDPATGAPIMTTGAEPVPGTQIVETWTGDIDWSFR